MRCTTLLVVLAALVLSAQSEEDVSTSVTEQCLTTYGPRNLASVPTTTRVTTTSITLTKQEIAWRTSIEIPPSVTLTITEPTTIISTETALQRTDTSTSTRTNFVSTFEYQDVTQTEEVVYLAAPVTTEPPPLIIPAPNGFTPLASNPSNAGADTYDPVKWPTMAVDKRQFEDIRRRDETGFPKLMHSDGQLLVENVPASSTTRTYTNPGRVICDVTSSIFTTKTKVFTARHSTITTTAKPEVSTSTSTSVIFSTSTEFPDPIFSTIYEDQLETLTINGLRYTTTTVTTTITQIFELPTPTTYAACGADNIVGGIRNFGIVNVAGATFNSLYPAPFEASSYQKCCEACVLNLGEADSRLGWKDTECAGSAWLSNQCYLLISPDTCRGDLVTTTFDLSKDGVLAFGGMVLSNGLCGQHAWKGLYCDSLGRDYVT